MTTFTRWNAGDVVLYRGVRNNNVEWAIGAVIVFDTDDLIAMYWRAGTPNIIPKTRPTPQDLLSNNIQLIRAYWKETDVLMLAIPGASHALYVMWETGTRELRHWYVDLIAPIHRTNLGFDTTDHTLDVVIKADKSDWQWKDEEEFAEEIKIGVYSTEEAKAIRAEGFHVINLLTYGKSPFNDDWEKWIPPLSWRIPSLPEGWDKISDMDSVGL